MRCVLVPGDLAQHPQLTQCVILPHLSCIPQHQVSDKVGGLSPPLLLAAFHNIAQHTLLTWPVFEGM